MVTRGGSLKTNRRGVMVGERIKAQERGVELGLFQISSESLSYTSIAQSINLKSIN